MSGISVLDPTDGEEKNNRLLLALDEDDSTSWETSQYSNPQFGGLKPHLGLKLDLGEEVEVRKVTVTSPTSGWNGQVYVAGAPSDDVRAWGEPVASLDGVGGTGVFEGFEKKGRYVLVLFTRLGSDNRVEVQRVAVAR